MSDFVKRRVTNRGAALIAGLLLAVGTLDLVGGNGDLVEPGAPRDAFTAHLDARVRDLLARSDIPGTSIAVVQHGELAWTGAYEAAVPEQGGIALHSAKAAPQGVYVSLRRDSSTPLRSE